MSVSSKQKSLPHSFYREVLKTNIKNKRVPGSGACAFKLYFLYVKIWDMRKVVIFIIAFIIVIFPLKSQLPPVFSDFEGGQSRGTELTTRYLSPEKVIWSSDETGKYVKNVENLMEPGTGQANLNNGDYFTLINDDSERNAAILLDFGKQIQGGIEIVTTINNSNPAGNVRLCFGESVAEAMSDVEDGRATNDHAMRDFDIQLPWLGRMEVGETGFRFVRIELLDAETELEIKEISASFRFRDIPYLGSFESNDELLNDIWMTGAYTVHLNMQDYLWDGIKRDRLVWVGDLHPEVMVINSVFGYNDVVPKSLDLARDLTPLPGWMNDISSYSMWWVILQREWYLYQGDYSYLKEQQDYLIRLLSFLATKIDKNGKEVLDGNRFLDWPTSEDEESVHAGLQAMMVMTFEAGLELSKLLQDKESEQLCKEALTKLSNYKLELNESKQVAALMSLAGLVSPNKANSEVLSQNGVHGMSTFYGYYMLQARALANDFQGALNNIREYWGGMLELGATSFWEDFNIEWIENAARIDELVPANKVDVHGTYGDYCYESYRHSLCHGWAAGPTAWLTEHVLGIKVKSAGGKVIEISPNLGDLKWVKGTFPTQYGTLKVEHRINEKGEVETTYEAPPKVRVILKNAE